MCDAATLSSVSPSDYAKMPSVIASTDPLFNVGKRELQTALRMASDHPWVADWLFSHASSIFHPRTAALPPEAFDTSLAIHLRHDISTPAPCRRPSRDVADPMERQSNPDDDAEFTVTKDIDLLLVPVVNVNGITSGYSFLKGVYGASMGPPTPLKPTAEAQPSAAAVSSQFIAGRFAFDNAARDFLMVVNSMSPHMTGIVSMRWRDAQSRDRSFFAIPKADYGPGNLPSRVLSVQCNVDFELPDAKRPTFQFEERMHQPHGVPSDASTDIKSETTTSTRSVPDMSDVGGAGAQAQTCPLGTDEYIAVDENEERDFANQGDVDEDEEDDLLEQVVPAMSDTPMEPWLGIDPAFGTDSWGEGLESIGTVITPFDDPNGVIPEILQDFAGTGAYMDDMERILSEASDILSNSNSSADTAALEPTTERRGSHKRAQDADDLALSPILSRSSSPDDFAFETTFEPNDSSWIFSTSGSTPDGVGVPRRPGSNDTSSGSFDMSTLLGSLATIERSLKGRFYGPKVRKDILHPQTGELISRCTGVVRANIDNVDAPNLSLLRTIAAQAYYSSVLSINTDNRLIAPPLGASPYVPMQATSMDTRQPTDEPRRKQGRTEAQKRPAPAPLAPRPVVTIALPPGLPHPEVLQLPETSTSNPNVAGSTDEKSAREVKLEAKRIKNRLSAARSNQKRRAQLEAQKKELATLRERVQELQSRETKVSEENENLKRQILSET